ncbi:unnamed protein product [Closterium sp. NIES-54]
MPTSRTLTFDPEGRSVDFPGWLRKLKLYLGSMIENDVRLLEHATGKLVAPKDPDPLGASLSEVDEARFEKAQLAASRWAARDDATVLAITNLLPLSEQHHFEHEVTAKGHFDAVVKRYSTPTTASLGRLVLHFLFPNLPSFPRVADLILHLRSLDAQLRSAAPDPALLTTNPPTMWMTLYLLSTHLPDRFATALLSSPPSSRGVPLRSLPPLSTRHLLPLHPRSQLLPLATKGARRAVRREEVVAVVGVVEGAAVEVVEGAVVEVVEGAVVGGGGGVEGVVVAAAEGVGVVEEVEVEAVEEEVVGCPSSSSPRSSSPSNSSSSTSHSSSGSSSSRASASRPSSSNGGRLDQGALSAAAAHPGGRRVDQFSTPSASTGCRLGRAETAYVADPTLRVTALRSLLTATAPSLAPPALPQTWPQWSALLGAVEVASAVPARVACTGPTTQVASLSFTLDSGASNCFFRDHTDLTPLRTPMTVALADPSVGAVVALSTTTLPCLAAPSGVLANYYTPSFSRNLVGVSHLHELGVVTTFPLHKRIASFTDTVTGAPLATFPREPGSGLYSLHTGPRRTGSGQVPHSRLHRFLAHLRRRALLAPHSSSILPTMAPFQTLHLDVWGPSPVLGPHQECLFLIVVDDYSRYTTVFPLSRKAKVPIVLEPWLLARGGAQGLCGLRLHSDCGAPPASGPAPSGVSHVTPQSSPPQHPVPVVSGGAGGAVAEGEGIGAAGAGGVGPGGAGGVGVEVTPVEDMAATTRRPRPTSPSVFSSVPQFPPRSSLRPVVAEPGGVPGGGTGGPRGVGGGAAGSGGAGAGGTGTVAPTLHTQDQSQSQQQERVEEESQQQRERVKEGSRLQQQVQLQPQQERVEEESRVQQRVQLQSQQERVEEEFRPHQERVEQESSPQQQVELQTQQERVEESQPQQ